MPVQTLLVHEELYCRELPCASLEAGGPLLHFLRRMNDQDLRVQLEAEREKNKELEQEIYALKSAQVQLVCRRVPLC